MLLLKMSQSIVPKKKLSDGLGSITGDRIVNQPENDISKRHFMKGEMKGRAHTR
jgi:hypothetical protein